MGTGLFIRGLLHRPWRRWLALGLLAASLVLGGLRSTSAWQLAAPSAPTGGPWSWRQVADAPLARFEAQGAVVNGKLYLIGGFYNSAIQATKHVDVYDPASNTWQRITDMPEAVTHAPVIVVDQTIYVLGGYVGDNPGGSTNHVWKLNTATTPPSWSRGPDLPGGRGGGGAARIGRRIHFFGGATRTAGQFNDTDRADHYVLNLDTGVWSSAAPLPNPRNHIGGVGLNGKVYAIGGQHNRDEKGSNQTQVDVYDPASNTWSRAADLPEGRGHITSSTVPFNGRILVIGGTLNGGDNGYASNDVLVYDPPTNVWLKMTAIPGIRKTPVADLIGDQIIVSTGAGYGATAETWLATWPDSWETAASMPAPLGEVAGGIISNKLYLLGGGSAATLAYNLSTNTWSSAAALAQRPFPGDHHAAEVVGGKLYLLGGLGSGQGKVQIFNPATNQWSLGADMPFAAGAASSALIGGQIYVAGGIVGTATTNRVARYNPATNSWAELAPMPQGRNHAAAASDGSKLYVFGGRSGGNTVSNGFDTVQVYDPASNSWRSSASAGSGLSPLPQARGGTGRAVYFNDEFYIFGGETLDGAGATANKVYNRVDIYHPASNTWRRGAAMPTARHGIFPLLIGQRIYVAGGGSSAGGGTSTSKLEVYNPAPYRLYMPVVTSTPTAAATARPGERRFQEAGGLVVAEAENAQATVGRSGFGWVASGAVGGYSGAGAMAAAPAGSTVIDTGYATSSPELRFDIQFATSGAYYVWVRAWAKDGSANSLHAGLDGAAIPSADRMSSATFGAWTWFRTTLDGADAQLTVGAAGAHTLNIWMREDGLVLDRVLLTIDPAFSPSGAGPAESPLTDGAPSATPTPTATATPTATPAGSAVRINAGGSAQNVDGVQWAGCASAGGCQGWVSGGFAYTQNPLPAISGSAAPANQAVYQTEWTGGQTNGVPEGGLAFRFAIPVSAGDYLVRLHFAELNKYSAGARVFDVRLEGATVLSQFDIWSAAGGANNAIVREFPVTVSDGAVTIDFIRRVENAKISAIEVIPATP